MKLFIVAVHMAQKRRISIILLMIEMILSSLVMISLIGQILFLHKSKQITQTFHGLDCYYFSPRSYYNPDFDIKDYLSDKERESIDLGTAHILSVTTNQMQSVKIIGYSDLIIDRASLKMDKGNWISDADCDAVPLVAVGDTYQVGQNINFTDDCKGIVVGTIKKDSYIISFMESGSSGNASLSNFISVSNQITFLAPYESEKYYSLPNKVIKSDIANYSQIISIMDTQKESSIVNTLRKYGDVSSIQQMTDNYNVDNTAYFMVNGMIFLVFLVLTVVGISGINGIASVENEYVYAVMYMLGLDTKKCMIIEAINTFMVVGISYLVFLMGYRWIAKVVLLPGMQKESGWILTVTFMYFLILYAITSTSSIRKAGTQDVIKLYKRKE